MLRTGRVSSIDAARHSAKVSFVESDGMVSYDLPVLVTRPGDYSLPPVDALVLCAVEEGPEGIGYVLGCIYSDNDAAPIDDEDVRLIASPSGALVTFDADGNLALDSADTKKVQINGADHPLPTWDTFESDLSTLLGDISTQLALGTSGSPVLQQLVGLAVIQAKVIEFQAKLSGGNFDSTKGANG